LIEIFELTSFDTKVLTDLSLFSYELIQEKKEVSDSFPVLNREKKKEIKESNLVKSFPIKEEKKKSKD